MKLLPFIFSFILGVLTLPQKVYCQLTWDTLAPLPPASGQLMQPGVAGAFAGISNWVMIVAGGANFPDGLPWEGGLKRYNDEIYLFDFDRGQKGEWLNTIFKLSVPSAYGASVSLEMGIVCIGGQNEQNIFNTVFLLKFNKATGELERKDLPPLPQALKGLAASNIGNVVYVAGGENEWGTTRSFYRINLDHQDAQWEILPAWPGKAITNAVLISQLKADHKFIYLLGGKFSEPGQLAGFTDEVFEYNPLTNTWSKRRGICNEKKESIALSAGAGVASGNNDIILFGGNSALVYQGIAESNYLISQAKSMEEKQYQVKKLNSIFTHHQGFDRTIYMYDTAKDTWSEAGLLSYPTPATINALSIDNKIVLPSGEVRPGVRTPRILIGTIK